MGSLSDRILSHPREFWGGVAVATMASGVLAYAVGQSLEVPKAGPGTRGHHTPSRSVSIPRQGPPDGILPRRSTTRPEKPHESPTKHRKRSKKPKRTNPAHPSPTTVPTIPSPTSSITPPAPTTEPPTSPPDPPEGE